MAVVLFVGFGPCLVLCRGLLRVHDYFKIREELIGLLSASAILAGKRISIHFNSRLSQSLIPVADAKRASSIGLQQ